MTGRRLRAAIAPAALLLLAACASAPPTDAGPPWTSGKLSLRVAASAERPLQRMTASFDLRGDDRQGELRLSSPLGSLLATAHWAGTEATLKTSDGERRFDDLDALAREALGEPMPLRALPDWLAGRPWPGAAVERRSADGFEQLGWLINLARKAEGSIVVTREAPPTVTLQVRLEQPE